MPATGPMWSVKAMRSLTKQIKQWGPTVLGAATLLISILFSINVICTSNGLCRQPEISGSDIKAISAPPESTTKESEKSPVKVLSKPKRILLPSIDLGIDVLDATIDVATNSWPLSNNKVQYANFTPELGSAKGTMLLYGHNTWAVIRKTADLKIGDKLYIVDQGDKTWEFTLAEQKDIYPTEVGFIYEDVPFRVVLFTCDGWKDQYRRLMYFS